MVGKSAMGRGARANRNPDRPSSADRDFGALLLRLAVQQVSDADADFGHAAEARADFAGGEVLLCLRVLFGEQVDVANFLRKIRCVVEDRSRRTS